jgi:hypothetical protein
MPATLVRNLVADLRPVRRPARVLYAGAAAWLVSGLVHLVVLAANGWAWSGAVSFRKPLTFSVSIALLLATIGWVLDRLPDRPRLAGAIAWTLLVSSTIEVSLITMQAWRGRASHFNTLAAADAAVFIAMAVMVVVMSLCLVAVLVWSLVRPPRDRLVRLAVLGGLVLIVTGLGFGQWIIELGNDFVETHRAVPDTVMVGERGVAKFPHAVALHGIQLFILAAVLARRSTLAEATRRRAVRLVVWSYAAALVFASAQTITGNGPFDPTVWGAGLAVSLAGIAAGFLRIGRGLSATGASTEEQSPSMTAA